MIDVTGYVQLLTTSLMAEVVPSTNDRQVHLRVIAASEAAHLPNRQVGCPDSLTNIATHTFLLWKGDSM